MVTAIAVHASNLTKAAWSVKNFVAFFICVTCGFGSISTLRRSGDATDRKQSMASEQDKKAFARMQGSPDNTASLIDKFPEYPQDVRDRFPSLMEHERRIEEWRVKTNIALRGGPQAG